MRAAVQLWSGIWYLAVRQQRWRVMSPTDDELRGGVMVEARMIVVGVDGTEGSLHALRWALGEARLRNEAVEVIHSWHVPYYTDVTGMAADPALTCRSRQTQCCPT